MARKAENIHLGLFSKSLLTPGLDTEQVPLSTDNMPGAKVIESEGPLKVLSLLALLGEPKWWGWVGAFSRDPSVRPLFPAGWGLGVTSAGGAGVGGVQEASCPWEAPCHTVTRDRTPCAQSCKRDRGWRMAWKDGGPAFSHPL